MRMLSTLMLVTMLAVFGLACEEQGPAEEMGEKIDESAEEAGNEIEEFGKKMEEKSS